MRNLKFPAFAAVILLSCPARAVEVRPELAYRGSSPIKVVPQDGFLPGASKSLLIVNPEVGRGLWVSDGLGNRVRMVPALLATPVVLPVQDGPGGRPQIAPEAAPQLVVLEGRLKTPYTAHDDGPDAPVSLRDRLAQAVEKQVPGAVVFDKAAQASGNAAAVDAGPPEGPAAALQAARGALYNISGGSYDSGNVRSAQLSEAQRTAYFRSPEFKNWVASEKAAGRQVFWLKDIDKTQASGDIFTYFFKWRADHGGFLPGQNQVMKDYLKTVRVKDAALQAEIASADSNDAKANAYLVIKLWRNKEAGGEGIGMLDFWEHVYWPTQKGLTKRQKLRQVAAFKSEYAAKVYPGVRENNRALTEAGVEVLAVSNGDQELAIAVAPVLGLKRENVVGSHLEYDPKTGLATGVNHAYEIFDKEWSVKPQPGKHLSFHFWVNAHQERWGWERLDKSRIVIAGADGDSAATDGGMWVYFPEKAIGNFMIDTPHEPGRLVKSSALAGKYGWTKGQYFTLTHAPNSPRDWDD